MSDQGQEPRAKGCAWPGTASHGLEPPATAASRARATREKRPREGHGRTADGWPVRGHQNIFFKNHGRGGAVVGNPEGGASGAGAGWGASGGVGGRKMSFAAFFFHLGLQLLVRVLLSRRVCER